MNMTHLDVVNNAVSAVAHAKTYLSRIISSTDLPLDERWELFRAAPHYLKENLTTAWDPELRFVGLPSIHWINVFGCNPGETCDPAEILLMALEEEDPEEDTIADQLQNRPIVLQAFKESILRGNVGTFICGSYRYYS